MEYYQPKQDLGFFITNNQQDVFIKSKITVKIRKGENLKPEEGNLSPNLIQYQVIKDANAQQDHDYQEEVVFKADALITAEVIKEYERRMADGPSLPFNCAVAVEVIIKHRDGTIAGTVTSTTSVNDDADIEVR